MSSHSRLSWSAIDLVEYPTRLITNQWRYIYVIFWYFIQSIYKVELGAMNVIQGLNVTLFLNKSQ